MSQREVIFWKETVYSFTFKGLVFFSGCKEFYCSVVKYLFNIHVKEYCCFLQFFYSLEANRIFFLVQSNLF